MSEKKPRYGYWNQKNLEKVIPRGLYCYNEDGACPFWDTFPSMPEQQNGYCHLLKTGDWEEETAVSLLWDQCKECGINPEEEEDLD